MELQHVNVKIYVEGELKVDPRRFIDVFHDWVREQEFEELLIDVADYRHVPSGPAVLLIGLEADYSLDNAGGRYGLRYNRKAPLEGSNEDRLRQAFQSAARACRALEAAFEGELKFSRTEFELFINDRALAPNTDEAFEAAKPELEAFLEVALGHDEFGLARKSEDPRARLGFTVTSARPFDLAALAGASA